MKNGSVVWITGGGTGIGRALAQQLCARGSRVAITGRRQGPLQETLQAVRRPMPGASIEAWDGDVASLDHMRRIHSEIVKKWGPVSLLINNAGVNPHHLFDDTPESEFEDVWRTNCLGAVHTIRQVLPEMKKNKEGVVVNISSILGQWASARSMSYCVSKYAVAGLTDGLRQELFGTGVHVMGVYPGFIKTDMTAPYVKPGSMKSRFGKTADQMATAILKGVDRKTPRVYFPGYSFWLPRLHDFFPSFMEAFARRFHL